MDTIAYLLRTRGYAVIHDFLDQHEVERIKLGLVRAIDTYQSREVSERSVLDKYNIHDLLVRDSDYVQLLDDARLDLELAKLLGDYWIMYAFTTSSLPPQGSNYARRLHVDSPRWVENYPFNMGVMWALDPFTMDNGAPEFLPGSHHSAEAPTEEHFAEYHETLCCPQGTLVIFDARVYHRAGINTTDRWRHALTMNACRSFMKQRIDWPRFLPPSRVAELTPRLRRVLGYDTRVPTNLDEMFLPEDQRLYKANQG